MSANEAVKVSGAFGSGIVARRAGSVKAENCANSRLRPSRTCSSNGGSKSVKNRNGARQPQGSPMKNSGTIGVSAVNASAARSAGSGTSEISRSPRARLPI